MVRHMALPQIDLEMECEPRARPFFYPLLIRNLNFSLTWQLCYSEAFGTASIKP